MAVRAEIRDLGHPVAMTDPRSRPDDRPNTGSLPLEEELRAIEGEELPADQDAVVDPSEILDEPEPTTDTERYLGEPDRTGADVDSFDVLADRDIREGETDDPTIASDEGLPYVPPTDPPVPPIDDPEANEIDVESDLTARVRDAFEADASTSELADRIEIGTIGGLVVLRGVVDEIDDGDALVEVASGVKGVTDVRDETEVAGL
jgi:BON domain-containing protein